MPNSQNCDISEEAASVEETQAVSSVSSESGQTLVEYALILTFVSLVVIAVLGVMGDQLANFFNVVVNELGNLT